MNNKLITQKYYPTFFIFVFFFLLLSQIFVNDLNIKNISQNYFLRRKLISNYNSFRYFIGDRIFPIAIFGENGWIYLSVGRSIPDYQKTDPISRNKLKLLTELLQQFKTKTNQYDGIFLLVVPPNKTSVYPQYMPSEIPVIGRISRINQLTNYLEHNSDIQLLDLQPIFNQVSVDSHIYYKTDTHWNCVGAFYAYQTILNEIRLSYPEVVSHPIDDFEFNLSEERTDMPLLLGINLVEPLQTIKPKFQTDFSQNDILSVMIFSDSFYITCLDELMETAFKNITVKPYKDSSVKDLLLLIENEKPDIVIVEFAERLIEYFYHQVID